MRFAVEGLVFKNVFNDCPGSAGRGCGRCKHGEARGCRESDSEANVRLQGARNESNKKRNRRCKKETMMVNKEEQRG